MKRYIFPICIFLIMGLAACGDDFLDRKMDTNYSEQQVFASYSTMRDFGMGIYAYLPHGFNRIEGAMLASATDEAVHSGSGTAIQRLNNGSWGPFNNPDDHWANLYAGIRKANLFLENTAGYEKTIYRDTITDAGKTNYNNQLRDMGWLLAEARFLRAYFYFELAKRYGGVPVITHTLTNDDAVGIARNTFEETVEFIISELDDVAGKLRETWVGFDNDQKIGRATKGAALALKARTLLYAASPLHNTANNRDKWIKAAEAAHEVIAMNRYSLGSNYRNLFRDMQNNEFIFERRYAASNDLERASYPVGFEGAIGGINPSQNLVDAYETSNGLPIDQDPSYNPQRPFNNRDPRLTMSIIVNGSEYKGRQVEIWPGGLDGPGKPRVTRTGYYLKKFVDEGLDLSQNRTSAHTWIYFRYAEILLNYAEAMNEAYGPDDAAGLSLTAKEALNRVRKRAGVNMPAITVDSKDEFRKRVRNERRVELAFEEHRFWDVRRWNIAEQVFGSPIFGVKVIRNSNNSFTYEYPSVPVEKRVFEPKMYLFPIPVSEITKTAGKLQQNAGW
jgi:starch-binding outer membrane protein, SusD/RagB family